MALSRRHVEILDGASRSVQLELRKRLRLGAGDLIRALRRSGCVPADLILCLVQIDTSTSLRLASRMIGKPITVCPPSLRREPPAKLEIVRKSGDDRSVTAVRRPRPGDTTLRGGRVLLGSRMYERLAVVRPGMTVRQMLARGVRRRDIRLGVSRGLLILENEDNE